LRNVNGHNNDPDGDIPEAWQLLGDITSLAHRVKPNALMIAEDCSNNAWITKPLAEQGCAFDSQWDLGLPHVIRGALGVDNEIPGLQNLVNVMMQKFNGDWRQRVVFADSHDTAANGGERLIAAAETNPHNVDARRIAILSSAIALTTPGIPMLLAGSEFLQGGDFNDWKALDWQNLTRFNGVFKAHQHLISLRRNQYGNSGGLLSGDLKILQQDETNEVLVYQRGQNQMQPVIVIVNFSEQKITNYKFPITAGRWRVCFNSSWKGYSDDFTELKIDAVDQSTVADLPPHVVLILNPEQPQ
jgi:1,4-alpha-glucan branching enzyme